MSDGEEYEQATPEQKLNIANYFVMSSPTGEVHDVLVDVAKLVNDNDAFDDAAIKKIMTAYNVDQLQPAKTPDGNDLIVSAYGQVGDSEYLDPSNGKVYAFDHRNHKFTEATDKKQALDDNIAAYRAGVEKAMADYKKNQYKENKCTITVYGADDGTITVCLSARNVRLSSFWTGGWRSYFAFNVGTKGTTEMKCTIKVNVHYFEDGNVQLHSAIEKVVSINVSDVEGTGKAVVNGITKVESEFQGALEEMYVKMHGTTFKAMRRFLPVTKQPMNWNVNAHGAMQK